MSQHNERLCDFFAAVAASGPMSDETRTRVVDTILDSEHGGTVEELRVAWWRRENLRVAQERAARQRADRGWPRRPTAADGRRT